MRRRPVWLATLLILAMFAWAPHPAAAQPPTPNRGTWTCSLDNIAATLTECQPVAATGLRYYLTDVVAQSTTTTGGLFLLRTGTGANCGTGTASFLPAAATVIRFAQPANTAPPLVIGLRTPLPAPLGAAICVLGVATNTVTITLSGFLNP